MSPADLALLPAPAASPLAAVWSAHLPPPPAASPVEILRHITPAEYDALEVAMLEREQAQVPVTHHFSPGIYMREATLPAGAYVLGAAHREGGSNIALSGEAWVKVDGELRHVVAPCILPSAPGTRKLAYVVKEMRWVNVFATTETDIAKLEASLVYPSVTSAAISELRA